MKRRSFIHKVALVGTAPALLPKSSFAQQTTVTPIKNDPISICTWNFKEANATAAEKWDTVSIFLESRNEAPPL